MISGAGVDFPRRRRDSSSSALLSFFVCKFSSYLCICFIPCLLLLFIGKKPWLLHQQRQVNRALEPNLATSLSIWLLFSTARHGISYPTVAQCLLDSKFATPLVVTASTSALPTIVPPPLTLLVTAHPLETGDFFGSVCGFTGVSFSVLVGHLMLPKNTHMSSLPSSTYIVNNYIHCLPPTLASCLADPFVTFSTPDIEAPPYRQGFYGVKLHRLNFFLRVSAGFTVQECGFARFSRYFFTVASPTHYAVSSIDGSSQSRLYGSPTPFLVARTAVQECSFARSLQYHVTAASFSHYAVSIIDGSSQSHLCDFQTGAAIINKGSRMSCSSRTPTHRVVTSTFRPLFIRARILPFTEVLTTSYRLLHMTPLPPISRVRLVSPLSPLYLVRSPSLQATTIAPQAVVTNFTFQLERFLTFSGKLLESSPRLSQVSVLCFASAKWAAFVWVCSLTLMASDSPSLPQGVSMEGQPTCLHPAIQESSEMWFNCSQNPFIGFFKVEIDVCAFLRMQAVGLQVKLLFGSLLSLAISILCLVLVNYVVEDCSACNVLNPLGF